MKTKFTLVAISACFFMVTQSFSQATVLGNGAGPGTEFLGWDGTGTNSKPVDIISGFTGPAQNIRFFTNGNPGTQRMVIQGNDGNVGIGIANPAQRLSVSGGNIQLVTTTASYMIGNNAVLWNNNDISNIYVGVNAGAVDNGTDNTFVGHTAGFSNTSGENNTFVGSAACVNTTTGSLNTSLGSASGTQNTTGWYNTFLGQQAGWNNTTGSDNTFVGSFAVPDAGNLVNATAIGANALVSASNSMVLGSINGINGATANTNVGIGTTAPAQRLSVSGGNIDLVTPAFSYMINGNKVLWHGAVNTSSIFVGVSAGASNTTGAANSFVGFNAGLNNTTGGSNTFIGNGAASSNTTGFQNVAIGTLAGNVNSTGRDQVFLGFNTVPGSGNLTNASALGANAKVNCSNCMVLGAINGENDWTDPSTNIGIGTTAPNTRLHIVTTAGAGTGFRLVDGTQAANRVLTSDANGNASWQAAPTEPLKALVTQLQTEVEVLKQQVFALCKI